MTARGLLMASAAPALLQQRTQCARKQRLRMLAAAAAAAAATHPAQPACSSTARLSACWVQTMPAMTVAAPAALCAAQPSVWLRWAGWMLHLRTPRCGRQRQQQQLLRLLLVLLLVVVCVM